LLRQRIPVALSSTKGFRAALNRKIVAARNQKSKNESGPLLREETGRF
jgi:hypothetical protein